MEIKITALHYYPVKSCGGTTVDTAVLSKRGIQHDREWLVVDQEGRFLTQREHPKMCLIQPVVQTVEGKLQLCLTAPGMEKLTVPCSTGTPRRVQVWSDKCRSDDQGDEAAKWFSQYLGKECRLVRMADDFKRQADQRYAKRKADQLGFADGFPFLIVSQESLQDLNSRLSNRVPMDRFRPNIVVEGAGPFSEDDWETVRIGDVLFDLVKPCGRCVMVTIDQTNADKSLEPLRTMAGFRTVRNKVMFGVNATHHSLGQLQLGDRVEVLK